MPENMIYLFSFIFGILWGSFLNVCIVRIPLGESIAYPRSFCRSCHEMVLWYQNIPILSFLFLRGRCASCHEKISWQYPFVELLSGILAALLVWKFHFLFPAAIWFFTFVSPLIVVSFIDLKHWIIPDLITLPLIGVGVLVRLLLHHFQTPFFYFFDSIGGILIGGGFLYLISKIYELIRKQEGIGMGDVKLAAMFGAFLGWKAVFFIFLYSSFLGSLIGFILMIFSRAKLKSQIPYGPFLSFAAIFYLFFGEKIIFAYLQGIRHLLR